MPDSKPLFTQKTTTSEAVWRTGLTGIQMQLPRQLVECGVTVVQSLMAPALPMQAELRG